MLRHQLAAAQRSGSERRGPESERVLVTSMKAVRTRQYGSADVLDVVEMPDPKMGAHEVLVRVRASSVNPVDWKVRRGDLRPISGLTPPRILGADFAGEIEDIGRKVEGHAIGDRVFGMVHAFKGGAYAEKVAVGPRQITRMPSNTSFEEAAVLPLVSLTVHKLFFVRSPRTRGQHVLINGCTGGLGHVAVQMAKILGYRVTGVCSTRNVDVAKQLGADEVIDYRVQSPLAGEQRYDLVFDAVANLDFAEAKHILSDEGVYMSSIPSPTNMLVAPVLNRFRGKQHRTLWVSPDGDALREVGQMVEAGQLRPLIEKVYALDDIRAAHARSETGRVVGKLALRIEG